jgi:ribonuclease J
VPEGLIVDLGIARDLPRGEVVLLTAGSQAEAASALMRIAMDAHPKVSLAPGDTVVLSSRIIPGNERPIANLVNHLYRRGAIVHYGRTAPIHVSGHASQEELKLVLNLVRPQHFVPVHGEFRPPGASPAPGGRGGRRRGRLPPARGRRRARADGRRRDAPGRVPAGRVFVDGTGVGEVEGSSSATAATSPKAASCWPCSRSRSTRAT